MINPGHDTVQSFEFPSSRKLSNYQYHPAIATSATSMLSNQNPNLLKSVYLMKRYGQGRFL